MASTSASAKAKAKTAKENGNNAFKAGDYPAAIGHYTQAILADNKDVTYPLNRAAAYLKLGKNHDAERDCTTVIKLEPSNVKALFRRGQARVGLDNLIDAQKDFKEAHRLEPANDSVSQELKRIDELLLESKSKLPTTQINVEAPKRRRIPIEIVEPKAERSKTKNNSEKEIGPTHISAASSEDLMKPLSSRPLTTTATPPSTAEPLPASNPVPTPAPSTSHTFKDLQQTRQSTKHSRAGGGIFRSSGEHTIVGNGERGKPALGSKLKPEKEEKEKEKEKEVVQSPMSLFEFTRAWESLAKSDVEGRWQLLNEIPPKAVPSLFQTSLEASMLAAILSLFNSVLSEGEQEEKITFIRAFMFSLTHVPRFRTVVMFLSRQEKELAKSVWEGVGVRNGGGWWGV